MFIHLKIVSILSSDYPEIVMVWQQEVEVKLAQDDGCSFLPCYRVHDDITSLKNFSFGIAFQPLYYRQVWLDPSLPNP